MITARTKIYLAARFKGRSWHSALAIFIATLAFSALQASTTTSFDRDWRFFKGDASGADQPVFDDTAWRGLDLPHDWSIEGPFARDNSTNRSGGYLPSGVGWYRKSFLLPEADRNLRVFVEFDGVMANSDVWINGFKLGHRPYGYVSFRYELTGHLNFGNQPNILAVRVDNSEQPASRWYTGAGIYRHVRLVVSNPIHLEHWGTFITTPQVSEQQATVQVSSEVVNQSAKACAITLETTIVDPHGQTVQSGTTSAQTLSPGATGTFQSDFKIPTPQRWDLTDPKLYTAVTRVRAGNQLLDEERTNFGIREYHFDPNTGFWLNGRNLKIKGVCLHHDASALGAAVPLRAWERRLEILRSVGVNAIRTSHNPPAPEFLDLCDRLGFLVMDEMFDGWVVKKSHADYHLYFNEWSAIDTRDTVRRDRNHPSIILYSAGNEVKDTSDSAAAQHILRSLLAVFHETDPTRPITQALLRPNTTHDYDNGMADLLDIVGQNYRDNELLAAHTQNPARKILGTENGHTLLTWQAMRDNPPLSGQFLWVGIDYLGESQGWPDIAFTYGLFDRTGTPRSRAFQRQAWWSDQPVIHATRRIAPDAVQPTDPGFGLDRGPQVLFPDWSPSNRTSHEENVEVYTNCDEAELFLNGRSLGRKSRPADSAPLNWRVPFEPGTLRAVGLNGGQIKTTHELKTAGVPARLVLTADRSKIAPVWDDLSYVEVKVVDAEGTLVPDASNSITFSLTGPGRIAAVDSGNNASHELFQATERRAFQGRCFALIKATSSTGTITLKASTPGLPDAALSLTVSQEP